MTPSNDSRKRVTRWILPGLAVAACLLLGRIALGESASAKSETSKPAPLVALVAAKVVDLPHVIEAQGHVVPLNEVDVRPQVEGVVSSLNFQEGQVVRAGQLLFALDGGDSQALVRQAQARQAQVTAELADAKRYHARSLELLASKYISSSTLDAAASKVEMLQAQQQAARAEVESYQVRAGYSRIYAPISGRAGAISARRGALVGPSGTKGLVRIVQLDPIAVEFSVPERDLAELTRAVQAGHAQVVAEVPQGTITGDVVFTDNSIDPATGTIKLKAQFDNHDERLWPGAFVRLRLQAGTRKNAVVLPPQALLEGPEGHFVYQVDATGKAHARAVTFTGLQDGVAVVTGLRSGDAVVVEGNQSIAEGMAVRTRSDAAP